MIGPTRRTVLLTGAASLAPAFVSAAGRCPLPAPETGRAILTLDIVDSATVTEPPLMRIYADGRLEVRLYDKVRRARLTRADLESLFDQIIEQQRFLDIDGAEINARIGDARRRLLADGATTHLSVTLPGCQNAVSVYGTSAFYGIKPQIDGLVRLRKIELALLDIVVRVHTR